MKDLKYLSAYLIPISACLSLYASTTWWSWTTFILAFILLPLIEQIAVKSTENIPESEELSREKRRFFDFMLYLNIPICYAICLAYFQLIMHQELPWIHAIGITLGVGIVLGTNGINVAHELGHRSTKLDQAFSKILLLPCLYQHFFVEHNRGHHKHVATDLDPATSRHGEWVYSFWIRSIVGGWSSAWAIERERLTRAGIPAWSWENEMIRFTVFQAGYLGLVLYFGGWVALVGSIVIAIISWLLLESINYIEHYGLRRKRLDNGRFEPVMPAHSWNSNHEMGRIVLYELTRHSDHHYKSTRKYQNLRHMEESPQLPFGYPASILLALVPPVWFAVMDPRVAAWESRLIGR